MSALLSFAIKTCLAFALFLGFLSSEGWAQDKRTPFFQRMNTGKTGLGFSFSMDVNNFFRSYEFPLVDGKFTTMQVGANFKKYIRYGMVETGLNYLYKGQKGKFNLPLVSQDYFDGNNTAYSAMEIYLRCGPNILRWLYPKLGVIGGYRFSTAGMFKPGNDTERIAPFYLAVPLGLSVDLPTGFGTTGVAFYYEVGLLNVMKNKPWDEGGRMRSWNIEIHVMFDFTRNSE